MPIRRIRSEDTAAFRTARLRSLKDAPSAFGDRYEDAAVRPLAAFQDRVDRAAEGNRAVLFVVDDGGRFTGMAGAYTTEAGEIELVSMWVAPEARGTGAGTELVEAVCDWARGGGNESIYLWVTVGNDHARNLYLRCGFAATGESKARPINPQMREERMRRHLGE